MPEESDVVRRWRIGLRWSGLHALIWKSLDDDDPRHADEDTDQHDVLADMLRSTDVPEEDVYRLMEEAYDQGWKQALHEREHGRA